MQDWLSYLKKSQTELENELLSISRLVMENRSLFPIWLRLGFWVNIQQKRLLWHLIQLTLQLTLVVGYVTSWVRNNIKTFSQTSAYKRIARVRAGGVLTLTESILLLVLVVLSLVGVLIYS